MKLKGLIAISILIVASAIAVKFMYKQGDHQNIEEERKKRKEKKAEAIEARVRYDFNMLKDPATGKIPVGIFERNEPSQELYLKKEDSITQQPGDRVLPF
jgi:hypothetical protein